MNKILVVMSKEFRDMVTGKRLLAIIGAFLLFFSIALANYALMPFPGRANPMIALVMPIVSMLSFIAPLIGIALGFDAVSGEYEHGTLRTVLAQPVFRDELLNGKFLAALAATTLSVTVSMLIAIGAAISTLGITPTWEQAVGLLLVMILAMMLAMAYYSISVLASAVTKKSSTSIVISVVVFVFLGIVLQAIARFVAQIFIGPPPNIRITPGSKPSRSEIKILREYYSRLNALSRNIMVASINFDFVRMSMSALNLLSSKSVEAALQTFIQQNLIGFLVMAVFIALPLLAAYMVFTKSELK